MVKKTAAPKEEVVEMTAEQTAMNARIIEAITFLNQMGVTVTQDEKTYILAPSDKINALEFMLGMNCVNLWALGKIGGAQNMPNLPQSVLDNLFVEKPVEVVEETKPAKKTAKKRASKK